MVNNNTFKWLKDKPYISIPQYQLERGVSYTVAKADIEKLKETYYIHDKPEGLNYKVNSRAFNRRELNFGECVSIGEALTEGEVFVLTRLLKNRTFEACDSDVEKSCQSLVERDLIYEFNGVYFLTITNDTAELICDNTNPEIDSLTIAYIAHPILVNAIEKDISPKDLLDLTFIPVECKIYISEGWDRYKKEGVKPVELRISEELKSKPVSQLRFEIIESCVSQYDFLHKRQIDNEAQRNTITIKTSPLCSPEFKQNAAAATREIREELTLGNLIEIRKIIKGGDDYLTEYIADLDDDDDDDDDNGVF